MADADDMHKTQLPRGLEEGRFRGQCHAYAIVKAAHGVRLGVDPDRLLLRMASTPEEPSQTWRDNEDMEDTGEGYYASRLARGTELLDILAEHHVGFRPTISWW